MPDSQFDSVKAWSDEGITNPHIRFIIVFDILQICGLISLSAILCTASFSSRIRRSTTWFLFNSAWAFSCVCYLLILGHQTGPFPGPVICLSQAMLVYACPALDSLLLALVTVEIFFSISNLSLSKATMIFLYLIPYIVFVGILIVTLILGLLNPAAVLRGPSGMFCHTSIRSPSLIASIFVICGMTISLIMGVYIAIKCYRHWSVCKALLIRNKTPFALVLRVALVGICSVLSIGLAVIDSFKSSPEYLSLWNNLSLGGLALAVGVIFGSQRDVLRVWMFWRKPPQILPTSVVLRVTTVPSESKIIVITKTQP